MLLANIISDFLKPPGVLVHHHPLAEIMHRGGQGSEHITEPHNLMTNNKLELQKNIQKTSSIMIFKVDGLYKISRIYYSGKCSCK